MPVEIGPGSLVEAFQDGPNSGVRKGARYWVTAVNPNPNGCAFAHGPCCGLHLQSIRRPSEVIEAYMRWPSSGWAACCFKPVGGDREVEIGLFAKKAPKRKLTPQGITQYARDQMATNPVRYPTPEELRRILGL